MALDKFRFRQLQQNQYHHQHHPTMPQQKIYPDQLAHRELESHRQVVSTYYKEMSINTFELADKYKPDVSLIKQQPQLTNEYRTPLLDFLFKISKRTRVCPGTYYRSVRLLDRYCSKRIVLLEQAQLVLTTCLWLVLKTDGGCSHCAPSMGGRFIGPTVRARIPRLTELCQLCGPSCSYDEGMFVQMERHILDTLNWEVTEPSIYEWLFNVEENNTLTQYLSLKEKESVYLKQFIIDCSLYGHDLISVHPAEVASSINEVLHVLQSRLTPSLLLQKHNNNTRKGSASAVPTSLILPSTNINVTELLLINITKASETLISSYLELTSLEFIKNYIQESYFYLISLQKSKKRAFSETSLYSQSASLSSTAYSDSGEEDLSDTDSLFEHIVNRSMSLSGGGSRTPTPLPSPDKIMFNQLKRQNTSGSNYTSASSSPFAHPHSQIPHQQPPSHHQHSNGSGTRRMYV